MFKRSILLVGLLFLFSLSTQAQSSCSCSVGNGGCSASQSCGKGQTAVCTCSATGCSSTCDGELILDRQTPGTLIDNLKKADLDGIGEVLTRALGKNITFVSSGKGRLNYPEVRAGSSHWDILEFLSTRGELKISGHDIDFWRGVRGTLLNGGQFTICFGESSVGRILDHVVFISGKDLRITSGDPQTRIMGPIIGNSLEEILANLSKSGQVTIEEN